MPKFRVTVGKEFPVRSVKVIKAEDEYHRGRTRDRLGLIVIVAVLAALIGAAVFGLFDGSFDEIDAVWKVAALPLGLV